MCEFYDRDGVQLGAGDKVEFWGVELDWIPATILAIEFVEKMDYVPNDSGGSDLKPVKKMKIKVQPTNRHGSRYGGNAVKLSKPDNIRKVI